MNNKISTSDIFTGYVVEVIKNKRGKPTLELRVRIPSIHNTGSISRIEDKDLPIAKPLLIPTAAVNLELFEDFIKSITKVFIIFEGGNLNKPLWLGFKGENEIFRMPEEDEIDLSKIPEIFYAAEEDNLEETKDKVKYFYIIKEDEIDLSKTSEIFYVTEENNLEETKYKVKYFYIIEEDEIDLSETKYKVKYFYIIEE